MKDIQEIMMEMENLSNQMAVSVTEETKDLVATKKSLNLNPTQQPVNCIDCSGTGGATDCNNLPTPSRLVTFTTQIAAPQGFVFSTRTSAVSPRIIYDLSCLHCFVEQCICNQNLVRYAVRIVGCIPYIVDVLVDRRANQCLSDGPVSLCNHDSVCVDNTICFGCSEVQSLVACSLIDRNLTCANIPVTLTATFNQAATLVTINGTFTLPACNSGAATI